MLGVTRDHTYTLEMNTVKSDHGSPYLWVRIEELPDFLMPYENMRALLAEWDFAADDSPAYVGQIHLTETWLDIYTPGEKVAVS